MTVRYDFAEVRDDGPHPNFAVAGGLEKGDFEGLFGFNDSDVYKVIEGASYSLRLHPDPDLERLSRRASSRRSPPPRRRTATSTPRARSRRSPRRRPAA